MGERAEDHFKALIGLGHQPSDDALAVGATDWVNLDQRMKYILALFRSRAQDRNLTDRPFSAAQSKTIASGAVPGGKL